MLVTNFIVKMVINQMLMIIIDNDADLNIMTTSCKQL